MQGFGEGRVIRGREKGIEHLHNVMSGRKGEGERDRDSGRYRRGNGPRVGGEWEALRDRCREECARTQSLSFQSKAIVERKI